METTLKSAIQTILEHEKAFAQIMKSDDSERTYLDGVSDGYVKALEDVITLFNGVIDK